jgi:hypothetical protein
MKKIIALCLFLTGCGAQFAFTPMQPVKREEMQQLAKEVQNALNVLAGKITALETQSQVKK